VVGITFRGLYDGHIEGAESQSKLFFLNLVV